MNVNDISYKKQNNNLMTKTLISKLDAQTKRVRPTSALLTSNIKSITFERQ